jgi:DNA (cytosine-5)-methyltransferase 1
MKILNLYCGIGGNRKLWPDGHKITAVEFNPDIAKIYQDFFPDDIVIVGDAHQYLLEHYKEFDFIWASPPCPTHSQMQITSVLSDDEKTGNKDRVAVYPDMSLYQEIIILKTFAFLETKWVIENVRPYYEPLISAQIAGRHLFWSNFFISEYTKKKTFCVTSESVSNLQKYYDIDVSGARNVEKRKIMRNCVDPRLGLHIWNCAFRDVQLEMF